MSGLAAGRRARARHGAPGSHADWDGSLGRGPSRAAAHNPAGQLPAAGNSGSPSTGPSGKAPGQVPEAALKALVDAARKGDRSAFDELVRVTWARTYTLAFRLTGNEEDALDVVQEAYLRALRGLPRFRGEARFSTWLYRVTANCASNQVARSWRSPPRPVGPRRYGLGQCPRPPARARPRGLGLRWRRTGPPGSSAAALALAAPSGSGAPRRLRPFPQSYSCRGRDIGGGGQGPATKGPQAPEGRSWPTAPWPGGSEPTLAAEPR